MSTQEEANTSKRRGRPPKNPGEKIQDLNAYKKEWYAIHKNDDKFQASIKEANAKRNLAYRNLHKLMKQLVNEDMLGDALPATYKREILKLVNYEMCD